VLLLVAAGAFLIVGVAMAGKTRVIINLSEQRAYLVEQGKVVLISPIALPISRAPHQRRIIFQYYAALVSSYAKIERGFLDFGVVRE
jgi:hypothetical protein